MRRNRVFFVILVASLALSSCLANAPAQSNPTATSVPATPAIMPATFTIQPTWTPYVIVVTATQPAATSTSTPEPAQSLAATETPQLPTAASQSGSSGCNKAGFVSDINLPNGSVVAITQHFTKTWRLINLGTCTWTTNYQIVLLSGNQSSGQTFNLGVNVPPKNFVDITLQLTAPAKAGAYGGSYKLQSPDGEMFGIGDGNASFGFLVDVQDKATPGSFTVTDVDMSINASSADVSCPSGKKFVFTAKIKVNGPGTVTYHWEFSNGDESGEEDLEFGEEGSQSVSTSWTLGSKKDVSPNPFDGWARIFIDSPNNQSFSKVHFTITCD